MRNAQSQLRNTGVWLLSNETEDSPSLPALVMSNGVTTNEDIARIITESLDVVLDQLLGKPMRLAFYDLLERKYYMSRDDIPRQLESFLLILERNFGKNAKEVRRAIAQRTLQNLVANLRPRHSG
jgi:hypothetical protein